MGLEDDLRRLGIEGKQARFYLAALELGPHGIRVNAVSPGLIWREGIEETWPEGVASFRARAPLGRLGRPEEVAEATGVDPAYIGSMRAIVPGADLGDLVGAKQMGVDAAFARDMKEHFPGVDIDDLPIIKDHYERMSARPAVQRALSGA